MSISKKGRFLLFHKKWVRNFGVGVVSSVILSGCVSPPYQASNVPPPPAAPLTVLVDSPSSLAVQALLAGDEKKALEMARSIKEIKKREALIGMINDWSLDHQSQAIRSGFENGDRVAAFNLLLDLKNKNQDRYRDLLLVLTPKEVTWILHHEIHSNQEKLAIQTMNLLQPYKRVSYHPTISSSYAHWASRRFWSRRYNESLKLASQSLAYNPSNKTAKDVTKRILAIREAKISRGLVAYRHQHLHKAIRLWKWALAIDPSNDEAKKYILNAEELLKKVENIQAQSAKKPPAAPEGKK